MSMVGRQTSSKTTTQGIVEKYSVRTARSGNIAHEFNIRKNRYSLFVEEDVVPFQDGDLIRFDYLTKRLRSGSGREYRSVKTETLELVLMDVLAVNLKGYVYILSNPAMAGLLKVGFTLGSPQERAAELSAVSGVPRSFRVEWALPIIGDPRAVEQSAHGKLSSHRAAKEFFRTDLKTAITAVTSAYQTLYPDQHPDLDKLLSDRALDIAHRRARQIEAQAERKLAMELKAFFDSPTGRWLNDGSISVTLKSFEVKPEGPAPSLLSSMFGKKVSPWLKILVVGRNKNADCPWRMIVEGVFENRRVSNTEDIVDFMGVERNVRLTLKTYACSNQSIVVEVGNRLNRSPNCHEAFIRNPWESVKGTLQDIELLDALEQQCFYRFTTSF